MAPLNIYIGFDEREAEAFYVCKASLEKHTSIPLNIVKLDQRVLRHVGIYGRRFLTNGAQRIDEIDGKPFSTDFSFTRFLVPALSLFEGPSLFCDGDFLFRSDAARLFAMADPQYAVQVVKRHYVPDDGIKMDGQAQTRYRRKMWSSLMLFNCAHPGNWFLTPRLVNSEPGAFLHALSWLKDEEIGSLPRSWNWLANIDTPPEDPYGEHPAAVHYTLGIPTMPGYEDSPFAAEWFSYRNKEKRHG